jgi:hypothetical protein
MSNTIIPSDRSRINAILTRTRQTRMARGRLILGLETTSRAAILQPWCTELAYQLRVLVGRPIVISPWLFHLDAIKEFVRTCGATGITKIVDVARCAVETAKAHPGEQITLMIVGDCFDDENQDEIYSFAPLLKARGVRVIMGQDAVCATGEVVYREFARLTDGTFIEPFTMNDPRAMEKIVRQLESSQRQKIGYASGEP